VGNITPRGGFDFISTFFADALSAIG